MKHLLAGLVMICIVASGCDRDETVSGGEAPATVERVITAPPATAPAASGPRIVFLGDSITAGLGLEADEAFPAVLDEMLADEGLPVQIVNAGQSGDTTAGGLRRLDWQLRQSPDIVVVGLGANDGLRGTPLESSEQNLRDIIRKARDAGADVLLLGMLIPPNYGPEYTTQFRELYQRIAKEMNVPMVPFVLEGVGGEPSLNQSDGIHPTAEGQRIVASNILPHLKPLVQQRLPDQK